MKFQDIECKFTLKPIPSNYFVGRGQQLQRILELVLDRNNPGLINLGGPQKIGRTSLLNFLDHLSRNKGGATPYATQFSGNLSPLYIDMRTLIGTTTDDFKIAFINTLARVLESSKNNKPYASSDIPNSDVLTLVYRMSDVPNQRFLLLLDRAELLLNPVMQEAVAEVLGVLNDSLARLGIVLSFGTSGELGNYDVVKRTQETEACIESISSLMSLFREDIQIGLLNKTESQDFLMRQWYTTKGDLVNNSGVFSKEEAEWLVNLSGGHPYILNVAGLQAWEFKSKNISLDTTIRDTIEKQSKYQLKTLFENTIKRLSPKTFETLNEIAQLSPAGIDVFRLDKDILSTLEGEGLLLNDEDKTARIASPLFKQLIQEATFETKSIRAKETLLLPIQRTLIFKQGEKKVKIALTERETQIMKVFLSSSRDVVSKKELYQTVWGKTPLGTDPKWEQRLVQRISVLRKKLIQQTKNELIENVYGGGYRLIHREKFSGM
jgi:DNA-binding winged helix-turn-helix (wHTH) protein